MKRVLTLLIVGLFVFSLVAASGGSDSDGSSGTDSNSGSSVSNDGGEGDDGLSDEKGESGSGQETGKGEKTQEESRVRIKLKDGNYTGEGGQKIQVELKESNRIQIKVNEKSVETDLNISAEETLDGKTTILSAKLSNGKNAEVKVMPDVASEKALERLSLKVCSGENNCSIELKEVGQGEEVKAAYEVKAQKRYMVFGLFKARSQVQMRIDAETGEEISVDKPWWSVFATDDDPEEETEEDEVDEEINETEEVEGSE